MVQLHLQAQWMLRLTANKQNHSALMQASAAFLKLIAELKSTSRTLLLPVRRFHAGKRTGDLLGMTVSTRPDSPRAGSTCLERVCV